MFDSADQVEVMDLEPADLLERLQSGKSTGGAGHAQAMSHFFIEKNLAALREIALRRTADRLERSTGVRDGIKAKTGEHILICLSGAPSNAKVIRTAARMAEAFHGAFTALFVETPQFSSQTEEDRSRLRANLRLPRSWVPALPRYTVMIPLFRSRSTPGSAAFPKLFWGAVRGAGDFCHPPRI